MSRKVMHCQFSCCPWVINDDFQNIKAWGKPNIKGVGVGSSLDTRSRESTRDSVFSRPGNGGWSAELILIMEIIIQRLQQVQQSDSRRSWAPKIIFTWKKEINWQDLLVNNDFFKSMAVPDVPKLIGTTDHFWPNENWHINEIRLLSDLSTDRQSRCPASPLSSHYSTFTLTPCVFPIILCFLL